MPVDDTSTRVLMHMNGADGSTTFKDESDKVWTANGNAQIDTAQKKFGSASCLLDGIGDYLSTLDHTDFWLSNGSWTFDLWIRFNSITASASIVSQFGDASNWMDIWYSASGTQLNFQHKEGGTTTAQFHATVSFLVNVWYHVVIIRDFNTPRMFVDGVQKAVTEDVTISGKTLSNLTGAFVLGAYNASDFVSGWIDEFRFSKNAARWSSDFTPPTAEYPHGMRGAPSPLVGLLTKRLSRSLSGSVATVTGSLSTMAIKPVSISGLVSSIVGTLTKSHIEPAQYPSSLPVFPIHGAMNEYPKARDRNAPNREIEAICTELGINPRVISDAVTPVASPADVADVLDMFATILKAMTGAANWYGSAVPIRKFGWAHGSGNTVAGASTSYVRVFASNISATENLTYTIMPYDGTVVNLYVVTLSSQPGTGALTFSFRVDAADSGNISLAVPAGGAAGTRNATGLVTFKRGVRLGLKVVNSASTASAQIGGVAFQINQVG